MSGARISVIRLPPAPCRLGNRDHLEPLSFQGAGDGLAVQVGPDGPSFAVSHPEHAVQQPSRLKGQALSVDYGVEPDPRTAFDSICDEQRLASYGVVDDVMIPQHAHGVGADFSGPFNSED